MDKWSVNWQGLIVWDEEGDDDELYFKDEMGRMTNLKVVVSNGDILRALSATNGSFSSYTSDTGINDIFKVFKFVADNTNVEWVIHKNGDTYTIGTKHDPDNAGGWGDYGLEQPDASVHSHPGIGISEKAELNSMGYRIEKGQKKASGDWKNVVVDFKKNGKQTRMNYVYFPNSSHLYHVEPRIPRYIRNVNNYRNFYFGTLNNR